MILLSENFERKPPAHRFYCDICGKDHHKTEEHQDGCIICGSEDIFVRCNECGNLGCGNYECIVSVDVDNCGLEAEKLLCRLCYRMGDLC